MKAKILLCSALMAVGFCSTQSYAQLSVSSSGNVTMPMYVAIGDSAPNDAIGLRVCVSTDDLNNYGISTTNSYEYAYSDIVGCHIGVLGRISASSYRPPFFPPRDIIRPCPFDAGVAGLSNSGCGVYGSTETTLPITWNLGNFAGYFAGDVTATGALTAATVSTSSDIRFKDNIRDIQPTAINLLSSLRPVSFTFKQDSMLYLKADEEQRVHYGMIAQEVRDVLPDIVSENGAGYLSVNYIELIPLLIQALKQQQAQIDDLQSQLLADTQKNAKRNIHIEQSGKPKLLQNTPNPFNLSTTIGYYLPADTREAAIRVYDMNGGELAVYSLTSFGNGELTIDGGTFRAGMYLYSLIADGQLIDTKQMILTK